jgi:hypothetical protein
MRIRVTSIEADEDVKSSEPVSRVVCGRVAMHVEPRPQDVPRKERGILQGLVGKVELGSRCVHKSPSARRTSGRPRLLVDICEMSNRPSCA